jgi:hypothetical protein
MNSRQKKPHGSEPIQWYAAFEEALRLELEPWKDILEFSFMHQFTEDSLKMDVLVVKKLKDTVSKKNINAIFRESNIFEYKSYKSPSAYLTVAEFYKVCGYAYLYASLNKKDITSLTISFVSPRYPRELVRYIKNVRGGRVEEAYSGIYYISGDIIPMQIILTKRLPAGDNLWLKELLSRSISKQNS